MNLIQGLTATPFQKFFYSIEGGTIYFTLSYRPMVKMWFIDIKYNNFQANGIRVCQNYNLLDKFDKVIPFGLYVNVLSGPEPFLINDFYIGRVTLNILSAAELITLQEQFKEYKSAISSI
jgi:hypothetical protein